MPGQPRRKFADNDAYVSAKVRLDKALASLEIPGPAEAIGLLQEAAHDLDYANDLRAELETGRTPTSVQMAEAMARQIVPKAA